MRLSRGEAAIIIAVEVSTRRAGIPPTWTELAQALQADRQRLSYQLLGMRSKGSVAFEDEKPRSLSVAPEALAAAVALAREQR